MGGIYQRLWLIQVKFLKLNSFNAIIFLSQIQARSICKNPTNAKKFHWHLLAIFFRLVKNNVIPFPMSLLRHYLSLHFAVRPRLARKFCIHFHFGEKKLPGAFFVLSVSEEKRKVWYTYMEQKMRVCACVSARVCVGVRVWCWEYIVACLSEKNCDYCESVCVWVWGCVC